MCPKTKWYIRVFIVHGIYITSDPGSVHMGIFGFLLKLLKPIYSPLKKLIKIFEDYHEILTEDYNFPTLVSSVILIIASCPLWMLFALCMNFKLMQLHPLKLPFVVAVLSLFLYPQWSFLEEISQQLLGFFAF